nr:MAG: hypothetical protein [Bacteriophage sp.]
MIYKPPKEKAIKVKKNKQAEEVQKVVTRRMYTEEEVAEIVRMAQSQGAKE